MARQDAFRVRAPKPDRSWWLPLVLALVALGNLGWAGFSLWRHIAVAAEPFQAPSSLVMLLCALAQGGIAWRIYQHRQQAAQNPLLLRSVFWRWLFVGLVASYLLGLALGQQPGVHHFFRVSLVFWYTMALLPLVVERHDWQRYTAWAQAPQWAFAGRSVFVACLAIVFVEIGLRGLDQLSPVAASMNLQARQQKFAPGSTIQGRAVNRLGYWDDEFQAAAEPGRFRIAVLGDEVLLSGTPETNCIEQIEQSAPNVDVYHFALPDAGPSVYVAQLVNDVRPYQPDLVLTFVSVGSDFTRPADSGGQFDWRSLRLYQWSASLLGASWPSVEEGLACPARGTASYEDYLRSSAAPFALCRTPIDEPTQARWKATFSYLDRAHQYCRKHQLPMALVIVPGEFQVSPVLCEALRRRAGYQASELDLDLPQRRLVSFADNRQIPVLDLLPIFRATQERVYEPAGGDWNAQGHALAADVLGSWIERRFEPATATTVAQAIH